MYSLEAMTAKRHDPIGTDVQEWFDEEEARAPGFVAAMDEAILREQTSARLKKLRTDSGVTQAELATRMRVKQPVVARIESGKVMPDLRSVHRFAHALGFLVEPPVFRPLPRRKILPRSTPG
jgi:ribosome-binding protein aMBF1 (putative translation factor)